MWDTTLLLDIHILCERFSLRTQTARAVVGRGQKWMIFHGSSVERWRATTPKSHFLFSPSLKGHIWFLMAITLRCQHRPCSLLEVFHPTALQMSLVFTFYGFLFCAGALQATLPERPPKERCACTRCVPVGRVAMELVWLTPPPATRATAARVTVGATARWLWPCSIMRTTTAWVSAPCSQSASVWWLF